MNFNHRPAVSEDFVTIATFPQNEQELFFIYPKWSYPVRPADMEEIANQRMEPTVVTCEEEIAGYSNLYLVEEGSHCWLGNVIVSPAYRGKERRAI
ncbi:GNAT family N-acetyltransferase [Paenibacillus sp. P26]|nr:GNAT family N-acetyltransferase [Paenibacillus sp. P26]